jgi:hypothetical protein
MRRPLLLVALGALVALGGCSRAGPSGKGDSGAAPATGAARRGRGEGRDVTFLAIADTHVGFVSEETHVSLVAKLGAIAGHAYPVALGGRVATPRGLLVAGDLTEWGREEEWQRFLALYASAPEDGGVRLPLLEVVGNHDKVAGPGVTEHVAARHGGRWYGWDWDDVHFAALGEAPDDDGLAWLARDLAGLERNVPVVLYFHRPLEGPWSTDNWFGDGTYRARLATLLEGRCIAAIFHGHHHDSAHYAWRGIQVYKPGAVKDGAHTFAVTRIVGSTVTVAYFDYDKDDWTFAHTRDLCASAPP